MMSHKASRLGTQAAAGLCLARWKKANAPLQNHSLPIRCTPLGMRHKVASAPMAKQRQTKRVL